MLDRAIAVQFVEELAQRIVAVAHLEQRVHRGDDARLAAGLAAKGLRLAFVTVDAFVNEAAFHQRRIVGPAVDVRPDAVEIDIRIAALGHATEVGVDALPRFIHLDQ